MMTFLCSAAHLVPAFPGALRQDAPAHILDLRPAHHGAGVNIKQTGGAQQMQSASTLAGTRGYSLSGI